MRRLLAPFARGETYRSLGFVVSALPLGVAAFVLLFAGWGVTVLLAITPLVVPLLVGVRSGVGLLAVADGALARSLLGATTDPRWTSGGSGFWGRGRAVLEDESFWRQQAYLVLRVVVGWPLAIAQLALVAFAGSSLAMPVTYRWMGDGDVVGRRIDTFPESLAFVPVGLVALLVAAHLIGPQRALWRSVATRLLSGHAGAVRSRAESIRLHRRILAILGGTVAGVSAVLLVVWAFTSPDGLWPIFPIASMGLVIALVAWLFAVLDRPELTERAAGSRALAIQLGVSAIVWAYLVVLWASTGHGTFWPKWVLLGLALAAAIHAAVVLARREYRRSHRIEELETTRAGAVDVQETELRRIERDLHDGAQARLVALGMSIGMAEEKLATDPEGARELLAEARAGAREALEELRDLARGIHPPILTDRGLDAAIRALAARTPLRVRVSVDLAERPRPPIETAAYFVVAEALANAAKHSGATAVEIDVHTRNGTLVAEVRDDGAGGADPKGKGLTGLRQRVEALDGSLRVASPAGGPTTVRAELPCGS